MKKLNWNQISELGLIERINKEILHPLGLAMYREVETGESPGAYVADDGLFKYADDFRLKNFIDDQVREKLQAMLNAEGVCQTLGPGCKGCPDCPGKSVCFVCDGEGGAV